jgi:hypothetical protein
VNEIALHVGVVDQRLPDRRPAPVHEVEHARRQSGVDRRLRSIPAVAGVTSEGFATDGIARGQRGREFPGQQVQRQVPRRDAADHAERLPQRVVEAAVPIPCASGGELVGRPRKSGG